MATFEFTITDADVGRLLDPPDLFLVSLIMTSPPLPSFETPSWNSGRQAWNNAYFSLQGEHDFKPLFSMSPQSGGGSLSYAVGNSGVSLASGNLPFRGRLRVVSVPRGSIWQLEISDVPVVRTPRAYAGTAFSTGFNYIPRA